MDEQELKLIEEKVDKALDLVQILSLKSRKPNELSGGQQQRVALARAIVIEPALLLMDEPLSNLDAKLRVQMRTVIKKLQRRLGITTIYVTHDQEEALAISDRIAVMNLGNIIQTDTPELIYKKPKNNFVAGFIGVSNFMKCTITPSKTSDLSIIKISDDLEISIPIKDNFSGEAMLSARPEQLYFDDYEGMRGTIVLSTFLGDFIEYEVLLKDGQLLQVNKYAKEITEVMPDNSSVFINIDADKISIYDIKTQEVISC